ncbi:MAG: lipid-A-disaccharide synthase [Chromatiales bacterium 21-64-14]|nr:MAG: lipid-A-disaccharide synthase [Chromatiales bacterium 21-64-14]HQU15131.1 lipid-A-disaccharide synthase [Gammaproteobacteria bacterium]
MTRIVLVAGEASGDLLGAGLIRSLRERVPGAVFEGVAGPRMEAAGCGVWFSADRLAVMGLAEVLTRLPGLVALRRELLRRLRLDPPDALIGIDAPDFNLGLERRAKSLGIPTVHYVSPSVWAWRQGRVQAIRRAVDLMLTLFPFEAAFYRSHGVPVRYVGHPLADEIPVDDDQRSAARARLGLDPHAETIALLPGSRGGELRRLAAPFIATAQWCLARRPGLQFVAPMVDVQARTLFERALARRAARSPGVAVRICEGCARDALAAADVVLVASGTATLEAMLCARPMVVAYRLHPVTYWIVRRLVRIPRVALPNLLSGEALVPEYLQQGVVPARLGAALLHWLDDPQARSAVAERFAALHWELRRDASTQAAAAILDQVIQPAPEARDQ